MKEKLLELEKSITLPQIPEKDYNIKEFGAEEGGNKKRLFSIWCG